MKITFSEHAEAQLRERELTRQMVVLVLCAPAFVTPDPNHSDRTRAYGPIIERDGRIMRVVYVQESDVYRVISAFLDRDAQRFIDGLRGSTRTT
jgi:hypothetical protein